MSEVVDLRPEALHSKDAEAGVVGLILANPKAAAQVIAAKLEPDHFFRPAYRALYEQIVEAYYADDPIDPISCGEPVRDHLAGHFGCDAGDAVTQLRRAVMGFTGARIDQAVKHAQLVRHHADRRALLALSYRIQQAIGEDTDPAELAGDVSEQAMRIATSTMLTDELLTFGQVGRRYVKELRRAMLARQAGVELGAWFDLSFIDGALRGLRGGELWFLAGEPGAGKSAVSWKASERFARRQTKKPVRDDWIGTLVASLEMGEEPSSQRWAMSLTGMDGGKLREADVTESDLNALVMEWKAADDLPLILNHSSTMRLTQLRALTVEAIRRHKIGLVVVDHWKYLDCDRRFRDSNDEDEAKARFLKQDLAKQLNVAVVCLAHTTKGAASREDKRPKMADLRGSGYVAAHADFISFVHRPYKHATRDEIDDGEVSRTDAEMLWEKARHSVDGGGVPFYFDPSRMVMY